MPTTVDGGANNDWLGPAVGPKEGAEPRAEGAPQGEAAEGVVQSHDGADGLPGGRRTGTSLD